MTGATPRLRERTRLAVMREITASAMQLFLRDGYEATTVEQIADAAGISRRSFFRYFASKDQLVLQVLSVAGAELALRLASRPAGEEPWTALRRCFDDVIAAMSRDELTLQVTTLMIDSPALRGAQAQSQLEWRTTLASVLTTRLRAVAGGGDHRPAADALCAAALACLGSALEHWVRAPGAGGHGSGGYARGALAAHVDEAMQAVRPLTPLAEPIHLVPSDDQQEAP